MEGKDFFFWNSQQMADSYSLLVVCLGHGITWGDWLGLRFGWPQTKGKERDFES